MGSSYHATLIHVPVDTLLNYFRRRCDQLTLFVHVRETTFERPSGVEPEPKLWQSLMLTVKHHERNILLMYLFTSQQLWCHLVVTIHAFDFFRVALSPD